ncbi:MAG: hypothetical protein F6K25_25470 [Okeania sp. SIO2G4]|uniref:hypothetical protein n=1 Tax=unclassified Okeania TaxID=2634635 RepID=UPI0013B9BF2D|nr:MULTISPECIES: hypothetical protein [unclassified Okeania]NEP08189.1 hypothetical protein [Okeania sp. SIO4D6]NEP74972.1 hypothetical protein [Okeania sp. SIO2G5]NEP96020.1 hypothetical protein [Okeania sp. SIO2F5]NEQ93819.1 hypothetical protein [Okeania sp. SIO2G4]
MWHTQHRGEVDISLRHTRKLCASQNDLTIVAYAIEGELDIFLLQTLKLCASENDLTIAIYAIEKGSRYSSPQGA